jgi:hypothetical protein
MTALYNSTNGFGITTQFLTTYVTGNIYLTFLIYVVILTAFLVSLRLDVEWIGVLMFVIFLSLSAYLGDWFTFTGILVLFFTALVTKKLAGS